MIHQINVRTPGVDDWLDVARSPIGKLAFVLGHTLSPQKVVIGGRLPRDIAVALAETIKLPQTPARNDRPFPLPQIVASEVEGDPIAIGAAIMPLQQYFFL
jgi:predicted NBD/HSP70 family sugar kinase